MSIKKKEVSLLVMIYRNTIVLESVTHPDQEILSVPGSSKNEVNSLILKLLGEDYLNQTQDFGRVTDLVLKPEETVSLEISIVKINIPDVSSVQLPKNFSWYSHEQISTDARCRRDKKFYMRLLEDKPLNVEYSEEQLGKWIDAKILYWRENP